METYLPDMFIFSQKEKEDEYITNKMNLTAVFKINGWTNAVTIIIKLIKFWIKCNNCLGEML